MRIFAELPSWNTYIQFNGKINKKELSKLLGKRLYKFNKTTYKIKTKNEAEYNRIWQTIYSLIHEQIMRQKRGE